VSKRYPLGRSGAVWAFGRGGTAWALAQRSAAAEGAARRGVRGSAGLQAADGDNLLPGPDLQREGAAAAADDGVGAVVQQPEQPDQLGREELGRQVAGQG
jgi:hypothetical protein